MIQGSDAGGKFVGALLVLVVVPLVAIESVVLLDSPWCGVLIAALWPLGDLWARHLTAELEVSRFGIRLPSFWHDNSWHADDIEWVTLDVNGVLSLMDRSGQFAQSLLCRVPQRDREYWIGKLLSWGYVLEDRPSRGRWRPSEPPRADRHPARPSVARAGIGIYFALVVLVTVVVTL